MQRIYKIAGYAALFLYVFSLFAYFFFPQIGVHNCVTAALILTAIGFNGYERLKSFSYTMWIIVAIILGMLYPHTFVRIGDFELKKVIVPFVQVTMLGMGAQMSLDDFKGVIKMPKGVIAGVCCHFTVMPLVAYSLSILFDFPSEIAGGVVLIGCVPSAMASNVMSYLAKANLALSVTIGAVSTLLAPFFTPLLMRFLGGEYIAVDIIGMMVEIINMIIVPVVAGFIFNMFYFNDKSRRNMIVQMSIFFSIITITYLVLFLFTDATLYSSLWSWGNSVMCFYIAPMVVAVILRNRHKISYPMISNFLAFVAMMGIVINTVVITASGRDSLMQVGFLLILSCFIHNVSGLSLGYGLAALLGLPEKDRRTIAFEVGMQNGGVATGLALQMGKIATVGLASAIFGPLQNLTGSALVNIFKRIPIQTDEAGSTEGK